MSQNVSEASNEAEETCNEEESFHIYVISFFYSLLAALIIAHLVCRWQLRRRKLSQYRSAKPGDKSFKSKLIQKVLHDDFAFIQSLSPHPKLINPDHLPREFGHCPGELQLPVHWQRMRAFDAAAEFVRAHHSPPSKDPISSQSSALSLPDFINHLQEPHVDGYQKLSHHQELLERIKQLYISARYLDGVFGQEKLNELRTSLQQFEEILSPGKHHSTNLASPCSLSSPFSPSTHPPPPSHYTSHNTHRESIFSFSSQEALLRPSSYDVGSPGSPKVFPPHPSLDTHLPITHTMTFTTSTTSTSTSTTSVLTGPSKLYSVTQPKNKGHSQDTELLPLVSPSLPNLGSWGESPSSKGAFKTLSETEV